MKVLAISYYAPPQLTPQAIQVGRLLYHLDASATLLHGRDTGFADGFDQYPDFFRRNAPLAVSDPGPPFRGLLHRLATRALPLYGACPDLLRLWRRVATSRALKDIVCRRPDVLLSFGMPMSCHLLGLALKRRTGLPWLAHFSDPWADNPFHRTSWIEHKVNARLERQVIAAADQLLFTSWRTLELVMQKYPESWRDRAGVVPHAWDMANLEAGGTAAGNPDRRRTTVVRHIGACYGERSPLPLFAALASIAERKPHLLDDVVVELVGHVSPRFLDSPQFRLLPPGLVRLRGQVGYLESLQLARDAAALLVIDAPSARESVFLPSKLVEYIGARRPVWGITPPGTSADLIAEWTGADACADPVDCDAVARMLLSGIAALRAGTWDGGPHCVASRFAPDRVSALLKRQLHAAMMRCERTHGLLLRAGG